MRFRLPLLVVSVCVATATLSAQNPDRPRRDRRETPPAELKNFTYQEQKFQSAAVGHEMPFGVYLPTGYDDPKNKDVKWPLILWLHGMWEDHKRFHVRGGAPVRLRLCIGERAAA
jgi:predicted peptidase